MRAVVTGGAGFIGSHVAERLIRDGHQVLVLDNASTGKLENLAGIEDSPRFSFERVDVADAQRLLPLFESVDWVFHLAALADIVPSIVHPLSYHQANVSGTAAVLEAARRSGVKRFVYAASSSCYGIADQFPTPESAPISPMYPYALSKHVGEQYVMHWARVYKLPCVSLRLFNVYGPRARTSGTYGAVFGVFLAQKLAGKPFTVVGDGTQTRDFTFVTDVADAFVRAAESEWTEEVFNIGSGGRHSINSLVRLLGGEVQYLPKRPGEPDCTCADIAKAKARLGWSPRVPFEEGVRVMLQNIEQWRGAPVWDERSIEQATKEWFACLASPADAAEGRKS